LSRQRTLKAEKENWFTMCRQSSVRLVPEFTTETMNAGCQWNAISKYSKVIKKITTVYQNFYTRKAILQTWMRSWNGHIYFENRELSLADIVYKKY
jgi:hypothetical protein